MSRCQTHTFTRKKPARSWEELVARGPFMILMQTHDHVWLDGHWPLEVRMKATHDIWIPVCKGLTEGKPQ